MTNSTQSFPQLTIGLDVSDRTCRLAALNAAGEITDRRTLKLTLADLRRYFTNCPGARVALEIGAQVHWIAQAIEDCGCEVIVANARQVHLISRSLRKTDANDALMLARLARSDPKLLRPIRLRGPQTVRDRALLVARDRLVSCRKALVNTIRSLAKQHGLRLPACGARYFTRHSTGELPAWLDELVRPVIRTLETLTCQIAEYDRRINRAADERYPETEILRKVTGVGILTSMAFVLAVEDPTRFQRSRDVGPYLGLTPRLHESGDTQHQLRITKAGAKYVRQLLVGSAQYILGRFRPDCDLKRQGQAIAERGGKSARKKAAVAVARKLAVLLHALWVKRTEYDPLRQANANVVVAIGATK